MSEGRVIPPAVPQASATPGLPSSSAQVDFHIFDGIDTKPPRMGIADQRMRWCRGFMPIGPSHLRILPGIGPVVFTFGPPPNPTIVWFGFGNIGDTPYAAVLGSDGSMSAINTDSGASSQIMPPGTITAPRTQIGFSQWGSQYLIFAKDQQNGYWLWDGTNLFAAGTFGPIVDITSGGSRYTSPPNITVQTTGGGSGVTFSSQLDVDAVSLITVTSPGTGFANGDFAILKFAGGGSDDTAIATANIGAGGGVISVVVTNPGRGYTFNTQITAVGGGGSGATFAPNIQNGAIISVTILSPGHDYTTPPSPFFDDPGYGTGTSHIAGGTGFYGFTTIGAAGISSIGVDYGGTGYNSVPDVTIIGDGTGAAVVAHIAGGVVTDIAVTNPGQGYTKALVKITGGNDAAEADPILMPYGTSGTAVEVYQSRVWIANGSAQAAFPPKARLQWSASENPVDFGNGGGALVGTDSFLRIGWHSLRQTNGFLYLIGDSSVNVIGDVNTTTVGFTAATATSIGTPGVLTTVFRNTNTDPQIGSPWPSSVQLFSRNIVLANAQGIHVLYGGTVTKVSAPLDGVYSAGPIMGPDNDFSSAVAQIFGIQVYLLLMPFLDPVTGAIETELFMYDLHKFWTSGQDVQLTYIASQEINSEMTAWGTDGQSLFRLFQNPAATFPKVVQSKLWDTPGYDFTKTAVRLYGILQDFQFDQPLTVSIDNETEANPYTVTVDAGVPGTDVFGPYPVGQQGKMIGFTVQTSASAGNLIALKLREQDFMLNT